MELERSFVRVPFEGLSRAFRSSEKVVEKELSSLLEGSSSPGASVESACASLDTSIEKLEGVKRKIEEAEKQVEHHAHRLRARISHVAEVDSVNQERWRKTRLDRVLVDYLLREGFYESAAHLASEKGIKDLVDIDEFASTKRIISSLKARRCTEALRWCAENRSRLRRLKSPMEFKLRIQEFVEVVRSGDLRKAINYARRYLAPLMISGNEECMKDVRRAMTTLAFLKDTTCEPYAELFRPERWDDLVDQFCHDNYILHSLTTESLLSIYLQVGLMALKTPFCGKEGTHNTNCPTCWEPLNELAESVPCAHRSHSSLVCRITGDVMDENNPPMVLPNGNVYSQRALQELRSRSGDVTDPQTGETFPFPSLHKAFIS